MYYKWQCTHKYENSLIYVGNKAGKFWILISFSYGWHFNSIWGRFPKSSSTVQEKWTTGNIISNFFTKLRHHKKYTHSQPLAGNHQNLIRQNISIVINNLNTLFIKSKSYSSNMYYCRACYGRSLNTFNHQYLRTTYFRIHLRLFLHDFFRFWMSVTSYEKLW